MVPCLNGETLDPLFGFHGFSKFLGTLKTHVFDVGRGAVNAWLHDESQILVGAGEPRSVAVPDLEHGGHGQTVIPCDPVDAGVFDLGRNQLVDCGPGWVRWQGGEDFLLAPVGTSGGGPGLVVSGDRWVSPLEERGDAPTDEDPESEKQYLGHGQLTVSDPVDTWSRESGPVPAVTTVPGTRAPGWCVPPSVEATPSMTTQMPSVSSI